MSAIKKFLEKTFTNVRSSHRTDKLHTAILNDLTDKYPTFEKYDWRFEYCFENDGWEGTFDVDIVGFEKDEPKVVILCKCLNSNVGKNVKNYGCNIVGDASRIMYADGVKLKKVLFINIIPRFAPVFDNADCVKRLDDTVKYKSRTRIQKVLQKQYKGKVEEVNVYYDIEDIESKKNKCDFDIIKPINVSDLELKNA